MSLGVLNEAPIRVPPLHEQRRIAALLSTIDAAIDLNRQVEQTLETTAGAIFRSWFVDIEPVISKAEGRELTGMTSSLADLFPAVFSETDNGRLPAGWTLRSLDTIANFKNGLAMQKYPAQSGGSLPVVKIAELRQGSPDGAERASLLVPEDVIIDDGDVVFSWSGSLLLRIWCGGRAALNQHLFKVTSDQFPKWFYYLWTREHLETFQAIAEDKKTTMGHIKRHHLSDAKVLVPPEPLIRATSRVLDPILDRIVLGAQHNRALGALRTTLADFLFADGQVFSRATALTESSR